MRYERKVLVGCAIALFLASEAIAKNPPAKPLPGQIIVSAKNPGHLVYNRDSDRNGRLDPVFLVGPGDPEGFLYLGPRNADGTRRGNQARLIERLRKQGGNCVYLQAVRSHGGDGGVDHNPFVDRDPSKGLSKPILDQWENWFAAADKAGIVIYFFFYDDSAKPFGNRGDVLPAAERRFVRAIVSRFKHHKHLIWCIAEEYHEAFSRKRMSNFAAEIRAADNHRHVIAVHHRTGDRTMDFPNDPNIDEFSMQAAPKPASVDALHADV